MVGFAMLNQPYNNLCRHNRIAPVIGKIISASPLATLSVIPGLSSIQVIVPTLMPANNLAIPCPLYPLQKWDRKSGSHYCGCGYRQERNSGLGGLLLKDCLRRGFQGNQSSLPTPSHLYKSCLPESLPVPRASRLSF